MAKLSELLETPITVPGVMGQSAAKSSYDSKAGQGVAILS